MNNLTIKHFLSLHQILIPSEKYIINTINDDWCEINYLSGNVIIKYIYILNTNTIDLIFSHPTIISIHIKRLLELKKKNSIKYNDNDITDYLFGLEELFKDYCDYCTICGKKLEAKGINIITCCTNLKCVKTSYQTVFDNKVTDAYKKDSLVFLFLLNILISGTTHPKGDIAYKPLPIIPNINNLVDLKKMINEEKDFLVENAIVKIFDGVETDLELIDKINLNVYAILKNAVSNNYFSMSSRDNIMISNIKQTTTKTTNTIKFIHINYSADIENKFTQNHFLFHGSKISSWYPIVKNGLKVMSGTNMMSNGAVYGNGIYFSDSFQMSLGYSSGPMVANTNHLYGFIDVVGVFEILEDLIKYKKTNGIYVIADDKIVLLRTLVLIKSKSQIPKDISKYFLHELPMQKQSNKLNVGILKNKRLDGEYKKLYQLDFIEKIDIKNQNEWIINFIPISNTNIYIGITFSNYPLNSPILKLINSNIKISGIIDSDSNINIDLTNPSNWKITNNLSEIMNILYKCFQSSL